MRTNDLWNASRTALLMLVTLIAGFAFGQNANTGEIKGTVTDPSGAVIDGVTVTITNTETGVTIVRTTNSAGVYDAPSVPLGGHKIYMSQNPPTHFLRTGRKL